MPQDQAISYKAPVRSLCCASRVKQYPFLRDIGITKLLATLLEVNGLNRALHKPSLFRNTGLDDPATIPVILCSGDDLN